MYDFSPKFLLVNKNQSPSETHLIRDGRTQFLYGQTKGEVCRCWGKDVAAMEGVTRLRQLIIRILQ
jgi:hypothetical protein